jgi:hypothetical protein
MDFDKALSTTGLPFLRYVDNIYLALPFNHPYFTVEWADHFLYESLPPPMTLKDPELGTYHLSSETFRALGMDVTAEQGLIDIILKYKKGEAPHGTSESKSTFDPYVAFLDRGIRAQFPPQPQPGYPLTRPDKPGIYG